MDISIIIVNYNTKELTAAAIESVFGSQTSCLFEVIVVDNGSTDGSLDKLRERTDIRLIVNKDNLGFAKANNIGIQASTGRYVLLLNSDTIMQPDTLQTMVAFMDEHVQVGASGCKVVLPDGTLDKACRRGFPTPWASFCYAFGLSRLFPKSPHFTQYHLSHLDPDEEYPVDCLVGAFMLVRRQAIEQAGLLDEDFFMYGEDIDWCYRFKEAGWVNYYYPRTSIIHYKGGGSRRRSLKIIYEFHRAMYLFHRKHYQKKYFFVTNLLVFLGIGIKMGIAILTNSFRT